MIEEGKAYHVNINNVDIYYDGVNITEVNGRTVTFSDGTTINLDKKELIESAERFISTLGANGRTVFPGQLRGVRFR